MEEEASLFIWYLPLFSLLFSFLFSLFFSTASLYFSLSLSLSKRWQVASTGFYKRLNVLGQAVALCVRDEQPSRRMCGALSSLAPRGSGSLPHRTQGPPLATSSPSYGRTATSNRFHLHGRLPPPPPSPTVRISHPSRSQTPAEASEAACMPISRLTSWSRTRRPLSLFSLVVTSYIAHRHDSDLRPALYCSVVIM